MYRVVLMLMVSACASQRAPTARSADASRNGEAPSQAQVHAMLVRRCGECHQGNRPTAVAEALAVFDLDLSDWPRRFDTRRFRVALERLGSEPLSDREAFVAFHAR